MNPSALVKGGRYPAGVAPIKRHVENRCCTERSR
jgi:hypothetical protein